MSSDDDIKQSNVEFIEESSNGGSIDADEEKKLVRKIDLMLLPAIWLMYLLSYMDRTNMSVRLRRSLCLGDHSTNLCCV